MLAKAQELGLEYQFAHQPPDFYEIYWYIMFFPKQIALDINGVDLKYQNGVYAEDDQFKMRMRMAGCPEVYAGRPLLAGSIKDYIIGIHQSHAYEKHKRQQRDSRHWEKGATRNRELFRQFCSGGEYTIANTEFDFDIWSNNLIVSEKVYEIRKS